MVDNDREMGEHASKLEDHDRRIGEVETELKAVAAIQHENAVLLGLLSKVVGGMCAVVLLAVLYTLLKSIGIQGAA